MPTLYTARDLARQKTSDTTAQAFGLAKWVMQDMVDEAWFEKYVGENCKGDFFRIHALGLDADAKINRAVALGEYLFNLQSVEGFDNIILKLKNDPKGIERTFCEVEVGALLRMWGYRFVFVKEVGEKGRDFDICLNWSPGYWVGVEAKCKINTTALSARTIEDTLDTAKDQLPEGANFIFMKVPQTWIQGQSESDQEGRKLVETVCQKFLTKGTAAHIASIKLYGYLNQQDGDGLESWFSVGQIPNEQCPGDWFIHMRRNPKWVRFFEFVNQP